MSKTLICLSPLYIIHSSLNPNFLQMYIIPNLIAITREVWQLHYRIYCVVYTVKLATLRRSTNKVFTSIQTQLKFDVRKLCIPIALSQLHNFRGFVPVATHIQTPQLLLCSPCFSLCSTAVHLRMIEFLHHLGLDFGIALILTYDIFFVGSSTFVFC